MEWTVLGYGTTETIFQSLGVLELEPLSQLGLSADSADNLDLGSLFWVP